MLRKRTGDVRFRDRGKFGRKVVSEVRIDLVNGGFEIGDYTGWNITAAGLSYAVVGTENPPEGSYSSKFYGGDSIDDMVAMDQAFSPVTPPTKIYFQYKFLGTDLNYAGVWVIDKDWNFLLYHVLALVPSWTQMVLDVSSGSGSPYSVTFHLSQPDGELHIDNIYLTG